MIANTDNRAVSALFRVFGGKEPGIVADAQACTEERGMHRGECAVLAILVPLTVVVALTEFLVPTLGRVGGISAAVLLGFLLLNLLPFLFVQKSQVGQWRVWLGACLGWAIYRHGAAGVVGIFASVWIGVGVLNFVASLVLGWKASVRWAGWKGILWRGFLIIGLHVAALAAGYVWGWPWALLGCTGLGVFGSWAVLNPYGQWLGPVRCTTGDGEILITIDDGPDPRDTPILLDLLDRYGKKAIFFMIGDKVLEHPELAREVIRRGHEIGNHTMSHPQLSFWGAGPWRTCREIRGCQQVVEEITGTKPRWFRAPVGHRNFFTHPISAALGMEVMAWSQRGFDAIDKNVDKISERILSSLTSGDIVLLHEAKPIAAELLEKVLERVDSLKGHPSSLQ